MSLEHLAGGQLDAAVTLGERVCDAVDDCADYEGGRSSHTWPETGRVNWTRHGRAFDSRRGGCYAWRTGPVTGQPLVRNLSADGWLRAGFG